MGAHQSLEQSDEADGVSIRPTPIYRTGRHLRRHLHRSRERLFARRSRSLPHHGLDANSVIVHTKVAGRVGFHVSLN